MRLSVMVERRVHRSVTGLTRAAAVVALIGLSVFAVSMLYPRPLVVIFSMSAGHVIGALAVVLYVLAVVLDTLRSNATLPESAGTPSSPAPPEDEDAEDEDAEDEDAEDEDAEDEGAEDEGAEDEGAEDEGAEDEGAEDEGAEDEAEDASKRRRT